MIGAGGGGFLMVLAENGNLRRVREAISAEGLRQMPFKFDLEGAQDAAGCLSTAGELKSSLRTLAAALHARLQCQVGLPETTIERGPRRHRGHLPRRSQLLRADT